MAIANALAQISRCAWNFRYTQNVIGQIFEEIFLSDLKLEFCCSCHSCFFNGEKTCPHSNVVSALEEKMMNADAFIIATPVYSLQLSGLAKNFIDHFSYVIHRPRFYDKKALVIATTAGGGETSVLKYIMSVTKLWGVNKNFKLGVKTFGVNIKISKNLETKVDKISRKFYYDVLHSRVHPASFKDVFFFNVWKAVNSLDKTEATYDYIYWKQKGWLKSNYYCNTGINLLKKWYGYIIYKMMRLVMSRIS